MKLKLFISLCLLLTIHSCSELDDSDYPRDISDIRSINFSRPDTLHGVTAQIKDLTKVEIKELVNALQNAKAIGPVKFKPDYYIEFTNNEGVTTRLKVNETSTIIKGYRDDNGFEIQPLNFMKEFQSSAPQHL